MVGRTTRKSSRKSVYVPFTPHLRLQLTGCLLLNWFLSGQAGFSRYWWSRRSNAQNLCYHLATDVPTAIQIFLTGVPTCSRVYLQLYRFFSRVCLRAHRCTYSYTDFFHGCAYVLTGVPTAIQIFFTGVPTCSRVYLQLYKIFSRVYLRAHGCALQAPWREQLA